jgi:hypothetical protein
MNGLVCIFALSTTSNKTTMTDNTVMTVKREEFPLYLECSEKILKNIDKNLREGRVGHARISKILTMRWFLTNEFMIKEI